MALTLAKVSEDQVWFEMKDLKEKSFVSCDWIPLAANVIVSESGSSDESDYMQETFDIEVSVVSRRTKNSLLSKVGWSLQSEIANRGSINLEPYKKYMVLRQKVNYCQSEWHLRENFILALGFLRKGDEWISSENFDEVAARLQRDEMGNPILLEIKREYLIKYLVEIDKALLLKRFHSRVKKSRNTNIVNWEERGMLENLKHGSWEGTIRDDYSLKGGKGFRIAGELWKNELIEPSS